MQPAAVDTDQSLVCRIKDADKTAMQSLYKRYCGYLAAICSRYVADAEDTKDVLQDTFLHIFAAISAFEYRGEGSLKAWMARIAVNQSLKFIRTNRRMEFVEIRPEELDRTYMQPDIDAIPPAEIHRLIRELPDGYRTIFNLYVIEGRSHREIASLLGIRESTSASQLHRAKALLASRLRTITSST